MTASSQTPDNVQDGRAAASSKTVALIVASAFFMQGLDTSIITTAIPHMATAFHVKPSDLSIGVSSYMLALAAFLPAAGWLAERFGGRNVFAAAIVIFTAASVLCSLSHDLWSFTAARVLQGLGGALMGPVGRMVVLKNANKRQLLDAMALITWPALISPVIGPFLGGVIVTYASWPWIFLVNLPLGIVGVAFAVAYVPKERLGERKPFDGPGFVISAVALLLLVAGFEFVAHATTPWVPVAMIAAGLALGFVAYRRFKRRPQPLIDLSALKIPTFYLSNFSGAAVCKMTISATPFLLPLMFQVGFGMSPIRSGVLVLGYFVGNLAMKTITTPLLRQFGFRSVLIVTGLISGLLIGACGLFGPTSPEALLVAVLVATGLARSMQFTALNTITFADVTPEQRTGAATLSGVAQQMTMTLAVTFAAMLLNGFVALRGGHSATVVDFQRTFLAVGAFGVLSVLTLLRLPKDAGAELAGRG